MKNSNYSLRSYRKEDMASLIRILLSTWTYDNMSSEENRGKATELFLLSYLVVSDHRYVLLDKNNIIGIILAHETGIDIEAKQEYEEKRSLFCKDKDVASLLVYNDIIHSVNDRLAEECSPKGKEITLLILDPSHRNRGLGAFLLQELYTHLEGPFYLFSDLDCSYSFYLRNGFRIQAEKEEEYSFFGKRKTFHSFLFVQIETKESAYANQT